MASTNPLDQFYTAPHEVRNIITEWGANVNINDGDIIIEPSAGSGNIMHEVPNCIGYDLDPKKDNIIQQDFLKLNLLDTYDIQPIHFIGNPPFGRCSNLAFKFIDHITNHPYTQSFSLVLPVSHNRKFYKNKIHRNFHLIHKHYVNDFVEFGKKKKVKCTFQIWVRKPTLRRLHNLNPDDEGLITFTNMKDPNIDFKVGNKKFTGFIVNGDYTYDKENRDSFKHIRINNKELKDKIQKYVDDKLEFVKVNKDDFVSVPGLTNCEIICKVLRIHYYG